MRFLRFWKCFKATWNSPEAACWINSKISNRDNNITLMIILWCHYYWSLLCNYWRPIMLWNSTSWSRLKLTVQVKLFFSPCDPFLVNNGNVTGKSVEKHCLVVLNKKLQVKLRFKTFDWHLRLLYTVFILNTTTNTACLARNFSIS